MADTLFALSSGSLPSGVAVIRVSGPKAFDVFGTIVLGDWKERAVLLREFLDPANGDVIDRGLVSAFIAPGSFTGENTVEMHCHGSRAGVQAVLNALGAMPGFRLAEAGEFSKQAFQNGKIDLTGLEGLADLISAQTESQLKQALHQSSGKLAIIYDGWRRKLLHMRAMIEAELDFADEDDVPGSVSDQVWRDAGLLKDEISRHLLDGRRGEIIREGFKIALTGPTNAGKSSLLNALAKRDVSIVTDQAGTTRDVLEVNLDIEGQLVVVQDTAGIRESDDKIENEGIKRARTAAQNADMVLWLQPSDQSVLKPEFDGARPIWSKADIKKAPKGETWTAIDTISPDGLSGLMDLIRSELDAKLKNNDPALVTRTRHRHLLVETVSSLTEAKDDQLSSELRSEYLRIAGDSLGKITGRIDPEELLGVIFSEFCIGK